MGIIANLGKHINERGENMYIHEATKKALTENKYITEPNEEGKVWFKIKPTNTMYNCKLYFVDGTEVQGDISALSHGWQPSADMLISDHWIVID